MKHHPLKRRRLPFALLLLSHSPSSLSFTISTSVRWSRRTSFLFQITTMTSNNNNDELMVHQWRSLTTDVLNATPDDIVHHSPQLAKDIPYAQAIQSAWRDEISTRDDDAQDNHLIEWSQILYKAVNDDSENGTVAVPLFGYCLRPHHHHSSLSSSSTEAPKPNMAGIILFHTGAGPHDIFLLWKAASLLYELRDANVGYVLIADLLSDDSGWAWHPDRTRYDQVRSQLMSSSRKNDDDDDDDDALGGRPVLQSRIQAAMNTLCSLPHVDPTRISAMGWCLGGQPIWELATMMRLMATDKNKNPFLATATTVRCIATFHGVCNDAFPVDAVAADDNSKTPSEQKSTIFICNGAQDPFVQTSDLNRCVKQLQAYGHYVRLLEFTNAKHGFTNPAQALNDNPAFDFDPSAAQEAWQQAVTLFRDKLGDKN